MEMRPFFSQVEKEVRRWERDEAKALKLLEPLRPYFEDRPMLHFGTPDEFTAHMLSHVIEFFTGESNYNYIFLRQNNPSESFERRVLVFDTGLLGPVRDVFRNRLFASDFPKEAALQLVEFLKEVAMDMQPMLTRSVGRSGILLSETEESPYDETEAQLDAMFRGQLGLLCANNVMAYIASIALRSPQFQLACREMLEICLSFPPLVRRLDDQKTWYCLRG
jgi:hypothetical protein